MTKFSKKIAAAVLAAIAIAAFVQTASTVRADDSQTVTTTGTQHKR